MELNLRRFRYLQNCLSFYVFILFLLIFPSHGLARISSYVHAKIYLAADLVIIGDILSCTTKVVKEDTCIIDTGSVTHWKISINNYKIKVDTVIKGVFADSIIIIKSEPYATNIVRTKSLGLDEESNSKSSVSKNFSDSDDRINNWNINNHKHIILLHKKDTTYISMLLHDYNKDIINYFYKGLDREGLNYFKSKPKTKKVFPEG